MNFEVQTQGSPADRREPPTALQPPELLGALNYREYLARWFASRKRLQPQYSGAIFAKKAGINSHTLLGMVIRGDRNLSADTTRAFVRALGLRGREALYFEKLVLFNQSKNSEDRAFYFDQLCSIGSTSSRKILTQIQDHASYLSHWYNVAIRELVAIDGFQADPAWIAKALKNKITPKQAHEAWELLLRLGMVEPVKGGRYRIVSPSIDIDPGTVDFAIRNFHREYLDLARDAIDGESIEGRQLSSMTFALSDADCELLKERIKEFRKALNTEFPTSEAPRTRVVAVNLQALILTENKGEKRK
jgi:uncharacterized protein (TIGR02147 family)